MPFECYTEIQMTLAYNLALNMKFYCNCFCTVELLERYIQKQRINIENSYS
jgi:hypothetical protein